MGWSWGEVFLEEIELHFNLECFLEKCGTIRQRCEKKKKKAEMFHQSPARDGGSLGCMKSENS